MGRVQREESRRHIAGLGVVITVTPSLQGISLCLLRKRDYCQRSVAPRPQASTMPFSLASKNERASCSGRIATGEGAGTDEMVRRTDLGRGAFFMVGSGWHVNHAPYDIAYFVVYYLVHSVTVAYEYGGEEEEFWEVGGNHLYLPRCGGSERERARAPPPDITFERGAVDSRDSQSAAAPTGQQPQSWARTPYTTKQVCCEEPEKTRL